MRRYIKEKEIEHNVASTKYSNITMQKDNK